MKHLLRAIPAVAIGFLIHGYIVQRNDESCDFKEEWELTNGVRNVALDQYWRRVTGYDSIQMYEFLGKREVNFCYPNRWERLKFQIDTTKL
jgi:hypothetical protein